MADSLSDLQTLIKNRIQAHADLTTLPVLTERDADLSRTLNSNLKTYGIGALVEDLGIQPTGSQNEFEVEVLISVKEQRSINDGTGSTLGISCAEVGLQILLQLFDWEASTMWGRMRNLQMETIQIEPEAIREISGSFRFVVNNN